MNPADALYRAITGGLDRADESASLPERLADIAKHAGSWKAAAALVGVSDSTLRKWRRGASGGRGIARPKAASMKALGLAQRRARLSPQREAYLRGNGWFHYFDISATVSVSSDSRKRSIQGEDLDDGSITLDGVIDAYLAGADDEMVDAFEELLAEGYFQISDDGASIELGDIDTLTFGDE